MPWCEDCAKFWNPNSMPANGQCPTCGAQLADPQEDSEEYRPPWHFKLLVVALCVYLAWRLVQVVLWIVR